MKKYKDQLVVGETVWIDHYLFLVEEASAERVLLIPMDFVAVHGDADTPHVERFGQP